MNQVKFWAIVAEMEREASLPGKNKEITAAELQFITDTIKKIFGKNKATSFIQLCVQMPERKSDTLNTLKILRDLDSFNWSVGKILKENKRPIIFFDNPSTGPSPIASYYNDLSAGSMAPQVRLFARNNYALLGAQQQHALSSLAP